MQTKYLLSENGLASATPLNDAAAEITAHVVDRYWVRWLTRFAWLAVVCGIIGAGATYVWMRSQPPAFRSAALVQIDAADPPMTGDESEPSRAASLGDEVFVVRSDQILRRAIRQTSLGGVEPFTGMTEAEIATRLSSTPALVVEPAGDQTSTRVIRIRYDAATPTGSQQVVQGILDAYVGFRQESFQRGDDEAMARILASRETALKDLQALERQHDAFLQRTELVFLDGEPQSVHRKIADRFLAQREELMIERAEIESRIRSAEINLEQSDPRTLMLSLKAESETASDAINQSLSNQLDSLRNELRDRASVRMRETEQTPLEMERDKLLEKFGRRHPRVREVQTQIDVVSKRIARMEAEEDEKEAMIKKIMTLGGKPDAEIDPQAELRARVELAINGLKQQLESLDRQLESVNTSYAEESAAAKAEIEAIRESERFERDIARQRELYEKILARMDEVSLLSKDRGVAVSVLEHPRAGQAVERPLEKQTLAGGLIGLGTGILLAMLLPPRQRDVPIQVHPGQFLSAPVLGQIPLIAPPKASTRTAGALEHRPDASKLCTVSAPYGRAAESFNTIRTALLYASASRDHRIIQVTSLKPEVGRSTVTANLAVASARDGKKVLLIDADLWRPKMQDLFGLTDSPGLQRILEGIASANSGNEIADQVMQTIQQGPTSNLSVLPAGKSRENPSDLLSPTRVAGLYESLRDLFDLVLVDMPPLASVSASRDLAPVADAVAVVIGPSPRDLDQAIKATEALKNADATVVGVIINGVGEEGDEVEGHRLSPAARDLHLESP
ncbi:polysaccharide biosynthesis tyrosine autokinase [Stieleria mannarensis]|uniref:polysaccharide biosynthesis tyrosine autokinase n=1 Tax=Stieleria mannarensis TaxID=2755585 RepID=UPI0016032DCD|nr:polysaccharide biosynthesis tyrosine autokinase [Rhodopirellula sp. JC639]